MTSGSMSGAAGGGEGALSARIHRLGRAAGLDAVGICDAEEFAAARRDLQLRSVSGRDGRLAFTYAHPERATDVCRTAPWARSLVVGGRAYLPASGGPPQQVAGRGRVALFATADHYLPLRRALGAVQTGLEEAGYRTLLLVDDNRLVDRAAAVRAGIGWWGKNTMVLAPRFGPWMVLGTVVTDAVLAVDEPMRRDCGKCDACIPACPTGALTGPGVLDASRCISHWLQAPGVIPLDYRAAIGNRFYGCDDCLEACPPGANLLEEATAPAPMPDMKWVLAAPGAAVMERFQRFYVPRRDVDHLRRNALIVLGNTASGGARGAAQSYLSAPSAMLRAHAVWTVARLGGFSALARHEAEETEPIVLFEYEHVRSGRVPSLP